MPRIRIKNWGSIKESFKFSDVFFNLGKYTVFIGGLGTAKVPLQN